MSLRSNMARRRVYDALEPSSEIRWYVVRDMHGNLLESRRLPRGTDLKRTIIAAMIERIDSGWQLGEFSSTAGHFFCSRSTERIEVCIQALEPGMRTYGPSWHDPCP